MATVVTELRRTKLTERLDLLVQQYEAAWTQLNTTIDAAVRVTLQAKINDLEAEMARVESELNALDRSPTAHPVRQQRAWKQFFPQLDFDEPWRQFRDIFDNHLQERTGGSLLILLPDRNNKRADLLVRRMHDWLEGEIGYGKVTHYPFEILEHNELTNVQFLQRLGSLYDYPLPARPNPVMATEGLQDYADQLMHKMLGALDAQHALLLDVTMGRGLYTAETFIDWLVGSFWQALTQTLRQIANEHSPFIKCIMVVSTLEESPPPVAHQSNRYCRADQIRPQDLARRIVCMPLPRWTEDDIERWLYAHSGLDASLTPAEIHRKAHAIYLKGGNGVPAHTLRCLEEFLESQSS